MLGLASLSALHIPSFAQFHGEKGITRFHLHVPDNHLFLAPERYMPEHTILSMVLMCRLLLCFRTYSYVEFSVLRDRLSRCFFWFCGTGGGGACCFAGQGGGVVFCGTGGGVVVVLVLIHPPQPTHGGGVKKSRLTD